jgi:hypothetical protein
LESTAPEHREREGTIVLVDPTSQVAIKDEIGDLPDTYARKPAAHVHDFLRMSVVLTAKGEQEHRVDVVGSDRGDLAQLRAMLRERRGNRCKAMRVQV